MKTAENREFTVYFSSSGDLPIYATSAEEATKIFLADYQEDAVREMYMNGIQVTKVEESPALPSLSDVLEGLQNLIQSKSDNGPSQESEELAVLKQTQTLLTHIQKMSARVNKHSDEDQEDEEDFYD